MRAKALAAKQTPRKRSWLRLAGAVPLALALGIGMVPATASAQADSYTCASGLNTGTTGWATCWGGPVKFRLILNCYYAPQVVTGWHSQAGGSYTIYGSCPSWSHITAHFYQTEG